MGSRPYPAEAIYALFLAASGWLTRPFLEDWAEWGRLELLEQLGNWGE